MIADARLTRTKIQMARGRSLEAHEVAVDVEGGFDLVVGGGDVDDRLAGCFQESKGDLVGCCIFLVLTHVFEEFGIVIACEHERTIAFLDVGGEGMERIRREAFDHVGKDGFDNETLGNGKSVGDGGLASVD